MSVVSLRPAVPFLPAAPAAAPTALAGLEAKAFALALLRDQRCAAHLITHAIDIHDITGRHLFDILLNLGALNAASLYRAVATAWSVDHVRLHRARPDPCLFDATEAVEFLRRDLIPWRRVGGATVIVTAYPDRWPEEEAWLQQRFGPVAMAVAPARAIEAAIHALHGPRLAELAETRVPAQESCRTFDAARLRGPILTTATVLISLAVWVPVQLGLFLLCLSFAATFAFAVLKLLVLRGPGPDWPSAQIVPLRPAQPMVSLIIGLYHESNIASRLIARLERLDYPKDRLEVLLAVEADDRQTQNALRVPDLPDWMRILVVPAGSIKTKPRALNYALDQCRGTIVGVYDAEDAPEPQQIRKVVDRFQTSPPDVACLQGILDFYNPTSNWLARCFTMEYAAWFRLFLPGIARLGLPVPLGGTTLFFRREVLQELGGWDAQNVTEDADLGLRLVRHGYRTELLDTVTYEEANCRARPWVHQRSRWIKGYMMTLISHLRDPGLLWRQLGPRGFAGFAVLFIGSVLQSLLAPVFWALWTLSLGGLWQPPFALPPGFVAMMLAIQALTIAFDIAGLRRTRHRFNPLWVLTLSVYHMLATLAAYKALWELLTQPFYWDKTSHGHFDD